VRDAVGAEDEEAGEDELVRRINSKSKNGQAVRLALVCSSLDG